MATSWQTCRGQLNHSWLQNGVLVALNHALALTEGRVRTRNLQAALLEATGRWEEQRREIPKLVSEFEEEMSPCALFDQLPLGRCQPRFRAWLVPTVHVLWLRREGVPEKVKAARTAYDDAQCRYAAACAVLGALPEVPSTGELELLGQLLRELVAACQALSRAISAFPHEVRVI